MFKIGRIIEKENQFSLIDSDDNIVAIFTIGYLGKIELILLKEFGGLVEETMIKIIGNYFKRLILDDKINKSFNDDYLLLVLQDIAKLIIEDKLDMVSDLTFESNSYCLENEGFPEATKLWLFYNDNDLFFNRSNRIGVYSLDYSDFDSAMDSVIEKVEEQTGIKICYECTSLKSFGLLAMNINFSLQKEVDFDVNFSFWNSNANIGCTTDLHILPPYFKKRDKGELINGDTDSVIGNKVIESCYAPEKSKFIAKDFGSSWKYLNNPYCISGKSFNAIISLNYVLNSKSNDLIVKFLCGLLGDEEYLVFINGSFSSFFTYCGILDNPLSLNTNRGCEHYVIWEYLFLKQEGKLEGAIIPDWFWEEKWLIEYAKYYSEHKSLVDLNIEIYQELLNTLLEYLDENLFEKEKKVIFIIRNYIINFKKKEDKKA